MGNFQSAVPGGVQKYHELITGNLNTNTFSSTNSGGDLRIHLTNNARAYTAIYGGRNDLAGRHDGAYDDPDNKGDSCYNTVFIEVEKGSMLGTSLIFGGRSAQAEGMLLENNPYDVDLMKGYRTDYNTVIFRGAGDVPAAETNLDFYAGGLWGAEGWQANNNYVSLQNANVSTRDDKSRQLGILGGRGLYNFRIYNKEESSIANNNIVTIKDSNIGTFGGPGMSVYGGYSYGQAKNNIVSMENTKINGNVYGGLELLGITKITDQNHRRQLHSNLVSLHNVELLGNSSIYGTATSDARTWQESIDEGIKYNLGGSTKTAAEAKNDSYAQVSMSAVDELSLRQVNRRRGIVHIGGDVKAASAYARYIHFGSYIDINNLNPHETYDVFSSYYPNGISSGAGAAIPVTFTQDEEAINLNQLVAGSYLWNTKGFHSSLSQQDDNQSNSTNGQHNFWVEIFTNISSIVKGDGGNLNVGSKLFTNGNDNAAAEVNHSYKDAAGKDSDLSLLAMDDGLVLSGSDGGDIMHDFRNYYQGRVLYLGVNNGLDYDGNEISAIEIAFDKINKFRQDNAQGQLAYGNTQVGIFVDGKGQNGQYNNNPYYKKPLLNADERSWSDMVIAIPNFKIVQDGYIVADATFGFYKYLHFDGKLVDDGDTVDFSTGKYHEELTGGMNRDGDIKYTEKGEEAGVGIKYWLKSLTIRPGALLTLKGNDGTAAEEDTYTLSAYVTGRGNVAIAEGTEVIMGDTRVNDEAVDTDMLSGTGGFEQENTYENQYTGATIIQKGASLFQGSQGALGSAAHHTSNLVLENDGAGADGAEYYLQGHSQIVGGLLVSDTSAVDLSTQSKGTFDAANNKGYLDIQGYARVSENGHIIGDAVSTLAIDNGMADIHSANAAMKGTFALKNGSIGNLYHQDTFSAALADIDGSSALFFQSADGNANIRAVRNAGDVFLSNRSRGESASSLNDVHIADTYTGIDGSTVHYRGIVQGPSNSAVDVVRVPKATGTSEITFGDSYILAGGVFSSSRGEKTIKENGIPVFIIDDKTAAGSELQLTMNQFGVVDKNDPSYEWVYSLGHNDNGSQRDWVLYNSINGIDNIYQRPESGAYVATATSWARMHMRLHDRFGQAYETDPFDADHKPYSPWVRSEGYRTIFNMSEAKTKSVTALNQIGGDIVRREIDDVWKYSLGIFTGNLYNRSRSHTWNTARARSTGYALGAYATLYTGNSPDDGFYVDTWLMYNHYDNKIYGNSRPAFKYTSHGWVYSVESGWTLPLGETGEKEEDKYIWTLQPEVQVIWDGVEARDAYDSVGVRYSQLGEDNVVIRAGARLHANNMNKGLGYIEANWIHNTNEYGVLYGEHPYYMEGGSDLGELRMGLEGRMTTNWLGWLTLGTQRGRHGYHNETILAGLRYMF